MTRIYAHRGASAERPENTLAAFRLALELRAFGVELDVHLSRDGVPVVIHDTSVDRTTNGTGVVADLSLSELQSLDAGERAQIPTLADVLDLIGNRAHLDIEVKANAAGASVLSAVRTRPDLRFAISSFDHDVLRHLRQLDPNVELWPLTQAANDHTFTTILDVGAKVIAIWDKGVDRDIVEHVREAGAECWIWTVNDPRRAAELAGWNVAGICTDNPRLLIERTQSGERGKDVG